ncbi:YDG/SRA domain-containing protein [Salinimicrobium oceani]|uniref:YDG domain-containing protein n=1 Tax=Salinimicrobium oceani TaxID=2722702 RepID=A0ABX1D5V3_9FLAO|nr:YDG/SRA domain-containing protein [Salinimicrobium oceani]NJW54158.1 hypothetical protein [Salinimicrobium oceani]
MSNIIFGNPDGVKEGTWYPDRASLIGAGLHRNTIAGIDGNGTEGAAAIVISGGYEDDVDYGDEIIYTGHGGNDPSTGKQIAHQCWDDPGNHGLVTSHKKKLPVRVIRGWKHNSIFSPKSGYSFDGLYHVVDYSEKLGKSGFKICQFKLEKLEPNKESLQIKEGTMVQLEASEREPQWYSIGVDAPKAKNISPESKMAQLLLNKKTGDLINFGPGLRILEIKRYLSRD